MTETPVEAFGTVEHAGLRTMTGSLEPRRSGGETGPASHNYAIDRTVLANERTYAAWVRTGPIALAAGIAIEKLLTGVMAACSLRSIAMIFILVSGVAFCLAAWRYTHLGVKLSHTDVKAVPTIVTTGVSLVLVVCSVIAFVDLWIPAATE